ncbi:MAG: proline racemase family protein [Anaerolineae bacterium]
MAVFSKMIQAVDSHTAGEPTRLILAGLPPIPGETIAEKWAYARRHLGEVRRLLMWEPRGHADMFGALLLPPCRPDTDFGLLFCDTADWLTMCGHGTIGTATALVELGMVEAREPETVIRFDTAAGVVEAHVEVENGRARAAWFQNVPSFLYAHDLHLEVAGVGAITLDIAFGGNFFAVVPVEQVGLQVEPQYARRLSDVGMKILAAVNEAFPVQHPTQPHIRSIGLVEFTQPGANGADYRNAVIFGAGNLDRSPCGTGTCARMAELYALGRLALGQPFVHESILGTRFEGMLVDKTTVGPFEAVIPRIKGSAYITGFHTFVVDPRDPLGEGFLLM